MISVDFSKAVRRIDDFAAPLIQAHRWLQEATAGGNYYVGWVNHPRDYDKE